MEYEIVDRPQMGEEHYFEAVEGPSLNRVPASPPPPANTEKRDRAIPIPEQESGS